MHRVVQSIESLFQITRQAFQPSVTIKITRQVCLASGQPPGTYVRASIPQQLVGKARFRRAPHKDVPDSLDLSQACNTLTQGVLLRLWEDVSSNAWPEGLLQEPDPSHPPVRRARRASGANAALAAAAKQRCTFLTPCKNRLTNGAGILILSRNKSQMVSKATCSPRWEAFSRRARTHKGPYEHYFFTSWRM